jgi:ADP-heptose:LPS heptosyltransferase
MNLGVGGNREKRVKHRDEPVSRFELNLVQKILADGALIILDKGYGQEELEQANALLQAVSRQGIKIAEVSADNPGIPGIEAKGSRSNQPRLVAFQGTINKFAALIRQSDCYIGYDSLGQHLAAALGRDVITVFAGYPADLFPERWKPMGKGRIHLVKAKSGPFPPGHQDRLVDEVLACYRSLKR